MLLYWITDKKKIEEIIGLFKNEMARSLELLMKDMGFFCLIQTHLGFDEIKVRNLPSLMRV